jgi:hypothetical protein
MGRNGFRFYPAAWSGALTAALAVLVAFKVFNQQTADYVSASGVAVIGVATAAFAKPPLVPAISAAFGTFLTSLAGFGFHANATQLAAVMGLVTVLGTYWVHSNVVPKAGSPSVLDTDLHPLAGSPVIVPPGAPVP